MTGGDRREGAGSGDGPNAGASLATHAYSIDLCIYCPKLCRHLCPVAVEEGAEASTPWGLMTLLGLVRDGLEAPSAEWAAALAHCTTCGRCARACLHHNDPAVVILEGRRLAWEAGVTPPAAREFVDELADRAMRLAARLESLLPGAGAGWPGAEEDPALASGAGGPIAYLPGCAMVEYTPDDVGRSLALLHRLGATDVVLPGRGEPALACCGEPLRAAGAAAAFAEHGRALAARLAGYRLVLAGDPACAATLRAIPEAAGVTLPPVRTAAEVAAELLRAGGPALPGSDDGSPARPVLLHEPCQALRDGAPAAAARTLARAAGLAPHALPEGDRSTACCGGRGGLFFTVPDTAAALARHAGDEAGRERTRAGLDGAPLVTSGARCAAHLRASGVEVRTLWELLHPGAD